MEPFSDEKTSPEVIADILAANVVNLDEQILKSAVCNGAPPTFVGRQGVYFVDSRTLRHPNDLRVDAYGAWGSAQHCRCCYYLVDRDGATVTKVEQQWRDKIVRKAPETYDICVRYNRYKNPSSGGFLQKTLFYVVDRDGVCIGDLSAVYFQWDTEPFQFDLKKHGRSNSYQPFQPTKPSVLNDMRELVKTDRPINIQKTLLAIAEPCSSSFDNPRNYKQVTNLRQATPGALPLGKRARQSRANSEAMLKRFRDSRAESDPADDFVNSGNEQLLDYDDEQQSCSYTPETTIKFTSGDAVRKFKPLFDRVLVERFAPETQTKGGIMIPEQAQGKVLEATVVATGPGARTQEGKVIPMSVKAGERVLLPEYGGIKVTMEEKEYHLFRESDIIGKWD